MDEEKNRSYFLLSRRTKRLLRDKKLTKQLEKSYFIMSAAGDLLEKILVSYSELEKRQVKKIESTKALNRDFYKHTVSVPSAVESLTVTNVNYYDNLTHIYQTPQFGY
ncbi:MAG: hypothetical protein LBD41_00085 [Clostridiales Family XIII bacterium]|jgi:hypothetical protein|nr:hypothetical protein [Clostridiales Family XIII bacterium]